MRCPEIRGGVDRAQAGAAAVDAVAGGRRNADLRAEAAVSDLCADVAESGYGDQALYQRAAVGRRPDGALALPAETTISAPRLVTLLRAI